MTESSTRLQFEPALALLRERLREAAPGRIQLLAGPRQVGKTTLLLALAEELGTRARYVACDGPGATLPGFWERLWAEIASSAGSHVLLLDEVQALPSWPSLLKSDWDRVRRRRTPLHVVATGSSALRLGHGARETLAGRFERAELVHWSAAALATHFKLRPFRAAEVLVREGGYPGAMSLRADPARWTAYVRDAIVEPAIGRDLLALEAVRKPGLLRQVFAACVAAPAQIVALQKLQGVLQDRGALETIAHYLALLEDAYLVAALPKFSPSAARRRAAPPKLVALSNALLAATDPLGAPSPEGDPARFGRWVENACLAYAWCSGQRVSYWREEPLEVDAILEGSWGAWAIEVKTGAFSSSDLRGVLELARRNPPLRPLVLCEPEGVATAERAGVEAMDWRSFLLGGPPGVLR